MTKLPALKPKQVIKGLEKAGFCFVRQKGSHRIFEKDKTTITVPCHNKDLKKGTLKHIVRQSGLDTKEFLNLL